MSIVIGFSPPQKNQKTKVAEISSLLSLGRFQAAHLGRLLKSNLRGILAANFQISIEASFYPLNAAITRNVLHIKMQQLLIFFILFHLISLII